MIKLKKLKKGLAKSSRLTNNELFIINELKTKLCCLYHDLKKNNYTLKYSNDNKKIIANETVLSLLNQNLIEVSIDPLKKDVKYLVINC